MIKSIVTGGGEDATELSRLSPLRTRLAAVFGVGIRDLLPVRGFLHAKALLLQAEEPGRGAHRDGGSCRLLDLPAADDAEAVLREEPGAVVLADERQIDWTAKASIAPLAARTANLFVYRELGAAFGAEPALCGALIGSPDAISRLSAFVDADFLHPLMAAEALNAAAPNRLVLKESRVAAMIAERARLADALSTAPGVHRVDVGPGPNLFVETTNADSAIARAAIFEADIRLSDDERILVGVRDAVANDRALAAFGVNTARRAPRVGEALRETKETRIAVRVDLDRATPVRIETGVGYFDHMLEQVAAHGGISIALACEGDVQVDLHHTIEDCALALGMALSAALAERRGIARYGFTLPMDEAEAQVSIDLGGRPYSVFDGAFAAPLLGAYPTEMTAHVFRSLAQTLGAAIHVSVKGDNDHHKTEACFKAFARALRAAVAVESDAVPSTKGVI